MGRFITILFAGKAPVRIYNPVKIQDLDLNFFCVLNFKIPAMSFARNSNFFIPGRPPFPNDSSMGKGVFPAPVPTSERLVNPELTARGKQGPGTASRPERKKLSIIILTFNEEDNINGVLECARFADEILVVDSFSTDRTKDLALMHDVVFLERPFDNFLDQRCFAARRASHDMIFFLDADERISDALREEILDVLASKSIRHAYKVPFRHHFMGRFVCENRFKESWKLRLFDRRHCGYRKRVLVHEQGVLNKGRAGKLHNPVLHFTYCSWQQFAGKKALYAKLKAEEYHEQGMRPGLYHFTIKPFWRFVHQYLIRGGFLYGLPGFVGAANNSYYVLQTYIHLWLLRRGLQ
jgi:glycosyltransferase involved in cell wall biosynthesis